jgi:hypothetical protein
MSVASEGGPDVPVVARRSATNWVKRSHTRMAWAVARDDSRTIHISMLGRHETGLKCDCVCPACGGWLQVNAGLSEEEVISRSRLGIKASALRLEIGVLRSALTPSHPRV